MPPDFGGTQFETDDDIRSALMGLSKPVPGTSLPVPSTPTASVPTPPKAPPPPAVQTTPFLPPQPRPAAPSNIAKPYRPTVRPPMAYLVVCDDGSAEGEIIRLRDSTFVIGRTEGDLRLPHDPQVSSRHLEIARRTVEGKVRWVVTDLGSSNGLFVRVSKTPLADGAEFLVGQGRYRFALPETETPSPAPAEHNGTMMFAESGSPATSATLTEILGGRTGPPLPLSLNEYWIGSDPFCRIARIDDPFCHPKHCRLLRAATGGWTAEHPKTLNGLWLRVPHVAAAESLQFQIGEQRFKLRVELGKSE